MTEILAATEAEQRKSESKLDTLRTELSDMRQALKLEHAKNLVIFKKL